MNDIGVGRTTPATPGLLNIVYKYGSKKYKSQRTSKLHDQFKRYNDFNDVFCSNWLIVAAGQTVWVWYF